MLAAVQGAGLQTDPTSARVIAIGQLETAGEDLQLKLSRMRAPTTLLLRANNDETQRVINDLRNALRAHGAEFEIEGQWEALPATFHANGLDGLAGTLHPSRFRATGPAVKPAPAR